jgi:hypothetical protein
MKERRSLVARASRRRFSLCGVRKIAGETPALQQIARAEAIVRISVRSADVRKSRR